MGLFAVSALICGLIGLLLGQSKNRQVEGLFLGLLLGVIGLIIVVCLSPKEEGAESFSLFRVVMTLAVIGLGGYLVVQFMVRRAEQQEEVAMESPAPKVEAATPPPRAMMTPRPTPDPFAVARSIERKYGTQR